MVPVALEKLHVARNFIAAIGSVHAGGRLQELNISRQRAGAVEIAPEAFGQCAETLERISAAGNGLQSLRPFEALGALRGLDLRDNAFEVGEAPVLSDVLTTCPVLEELNMGGCPLTQAPRAVFPDGFRCAVLLKAAQSLRVIDDRPVSENERTFVIGRYLARKARSKRN